MTPVLLIDDMIAFSGYVPAKEDIKEAIQKAAQPQHEKRGNFLTFDEIASVVSLPRNDIVTEPRRGEGLPC